MDAAGYLPVRRELNKPNVREICDCLPSLSEPLEAPVAEAAGEPMRPAILDKRKRAPDPRPSPALQVELELPLVAPDDAEISAPVAKPAAPLDRGIAVIDFYI